MKNNKPKKQKKPLHPPPLPTSSEGFWEDYMFDIDEEIYSMYNTEKHNAPIRKKIENLIISQHNSSWLGKWYYQIQINKLTKKLK